MKINTRYSDEVIIEESDILTFAKGIPAFEEEKQFVILALGAGVPFSVLQSVNTEGLAFIISEVFSFFPEYDINLSASDVEALKIETPEDVALYTILTIGESLEKSTANLSAPLVINTKEKLGKQVVLNNPVYKTKHALVRELQEV